MVFFESDLETLIKRKRNFVLIESSNTKQIKILDSDENIKHFYTDTKMNQKVHHIVKKLKNELMPYLPEINEFMLNKKGEYYFSNSQLGDFCARSVYNVDISSAYLTALKNANYISDKLHSEIFDLTKKDRLICLGLLAYKPVHFYYENGEIKRWLPIKNDFQNFFFFCVYQISEVIKEIVSILGDNHIFSWVDGVYFFENDFLKDLVIHSFNERNYSVKFEKLENFTAEKKEFHTTFEYEKEGKTKRIEVPTHEKKRHLDKARAWAEFQEKRDFESAKKYFSFNKK